MNYLKKIACMFDILTQYSSDHFNRFIPQFTNLFNDKRLSDNMNLFLQENQEEIFKEVKGSVENAVADVVKMLLQGPFNKFPYRDIYLP